MLRKLWKIGNLFSCSRELVIILSFEIMLTGLSDRQDPAHPSPRASDDARQPLPGFYINRTPPVMRLSYVYVAIRRSIVSFSAGITIYEAPFDTVSSRLSIHPSVCPTVPNLSHLVPTASQSTQTPRLSTSAYFSALPGYSEAVSACVQVTSSPSAKSCLFGSVGLRVSGSHDCFMVLAILGLISPREYYI